MHIGTQHQHTNLWNVLISTSSVHSQTFSRFVELYATSDATAKTACKALIEHVGRYGTPSILRSDYGPHFVAHIIDEFVKIVGTTHNKILPYCSEENAIVERINKEVNRHITAYAYERATT